MVIIGGGSLAANCASELAQRNHEVVIIEKSQDQIDLLSQEIDCGFILGDGAKPKFQEEASPKNTDALICLSDSDTDNILAAQVAANLEFDRIIVRIEDCELESVCHNLGIQNAIFTNKMITREIVDMSESQDGMLRTKVLNGDLHFIELLLDENHPKAISDIDCPSQTNLVAVNNGKETLVPSDVESLNEGDLLLFVCTHESLPKLRQCLGLGKEE